MAPNQIAWGWPQFISHSTAILFSKECHPVASIIPASAYTWRNVLRVMIGKSFRDEQHWTFNLKLSTVYNFCSIAFYVVARWCWMLWLVMKCGNNQLIVLLLLCSPTDPWSGHRELWTTIVRKLLNISSTLSYNRLSVVGGRMFVVLLHISLLLVSSLCIQATDRTFTLNYYFWNIVGFCLISLWVIASRKLWIPNNYIDLFVQFFFFCVWIKPLKVMPSAFVDE